MQLNSHANRRPNKSRRFSNPTEFSTRQSSRQSSATSSLAFAEPLEVRKLRKFFFGSSSNNSNKNRQGRNGICTTYCGANAPNWISASFSNFISNFFLNDCDLKVDVYTVV